MQPPARRTTELFCSDVIKRAEANLSKWGYQDLFTLGLAIAEEAGEVAQAILKERHEGGSLSRVQKEIIDLAALCLQMEYRIMMTFRKVQ